MSYRCSPLALFVIAVVLFAACSNGEPVRSEIVMGTVCTVTLYDQGKAQLYHDVFSRIREIENRMSANLPDSDVARINRAAGVSPVQVHEEVFAVIERALYFAEISQGAYEPSIGPIVSLWDVMGDNPRIPSQQEIDALLPVVNWRNVELDYTARTVFLRYPGMTLDLGGIAKGYAADEAAAIITKAGIKQAIVDLGGNILAVGVKQDNSPWRIGLQNPLESRGDYFGIVTGPAQTVVSSGVYERFFEIDDVLYHHIFSPFNGKPVRNGLWAVTIVTANSMDADALSTAVFVMGYEKGMAMLESLEGVEAVFVFSDMTVRKTPGLDFALTDESYQLIQQ